MKKTIVVVMAVLCVFSIYAAGKNSINVKFAPVAIQISTSSEETYSIPSRYGIGADVSYKRYLVKGLFAEGGFSWNTFLLPEGRPNLTSLLIFTGAGYDCRMSKVFKLGAHVDLATDLLLYDKVDSANLTVKTGLECGFFFNETIEATIGCDGTFGFGRSGKTNYVNYRILPAVGMSIHL